MTQTSAFHFESLVGTGRLPSTCFDWYFCRSGDAGRAVTSLLPAGRWCKQYVAAHHADCRAWRGDPRSVDPRLPPDKTVDLLEADVPLQFYLGDVDGVMLFQLYMVVLVLWLAKIFEHDLLCPATTLVAEAGSCKGLEPADARSSRTGNIDAGAGGVAGAYTGFLLSALKSYPFLNNPILPVLFLFSGISSGAAVALIAMAIRQRSNPHSTEAHFVHRMEIPVVWGEIFLLVAFFVGLALGDDGKVRALVAALGGGFWTWWFWLGRRAGADCANVAQTVGQSQFRYSCRAGGVGEHGRRVDAAFFILYAGQLTVA